MHIIEQTMTFSYIGSHDIIDLKQMVSISNIYNFLLNTFLEDMMKSKNQIKTLKVSYLETIDVIENGFGKQKKMLPWDH